MKIPASMPVWFRTQESQRKAASSLRVAGGDVTSTATHTSLRNFKTFVQAWKNANPRPPGSPTSISKSSFKQIETSPLFCSWSKSTMLHWPHVLHGWAHVSTGVLLCAPQPPKFLQGKPYHIYNLQFIKKSSSWKIKYGWNNIPMEHFRTTKKSHYYSWHYTRVEFITIWANNGLAELGKNQPSLHLYQVLIYTWGKENKHSGILKQLVQKTDYHVNKVTCTNRRNTPWKLTHAVKSHRSFGKHVLTHKQRQSFTGENGTKRDCGTQWMSLPYSPWWRMTLWPDNYYYLLVKIICEV